MIRNNKISRHSLTCSPFNWEELNWARRRNVLRTLNGLSQKQIGKFSNPYFTSFDSMREIKIIMSEKNGNGNIKMSNSTGHFKISSCMIMDGLKNRMLSIF